MSGASDASAASRAAAQAAVDELRAIRSTDPCAALAITTVKATIHTLETRWIDARPPDGGAASDAHRDA